MANTGNYDRSDFDVGRFPNSEFGGRRAPKADDPYFPPSETGITTAEDHPLFAPQK